MRWLWTLRLSLKSILQEWWEKKHDDSIGTEHDQLILKYLWILRGIFYYWFLKQLVGRFYLYCYQNAVAGSHKKPFFYLAFVYVYIQNTLFNGQAEVYWNNGVLCPPAGKKSWLFRPQKLADYFKYQIKDYFTLFSLHVHKLITGMSFVFAFFF